MHTCDIKGGQIVLDEIGVERSIGIEKSTIYKQYNVFPLNQFFFGFPFLKEIEKDFSCNVEWLLFTLTYFFEARPCTKPESELTLLWLSNISSMFAEQKPIKK